MQVALEEYLVAYNRKCPYQDWRMNGRIPWQAFQEERKAALVTPGRIDGIGWHCQLITSSVYIEHDQS